MAYGMMLENYMGNGGDAGGGTFVVKMASSGTVPNITVTPDKDFSEALAAYNSGKFVVAVIENINFGSGSNSVCVPLAYGDYMFAKFEGNAIVANGFSEEGNARAMHLSWSASSIHANFYNV